MAKSLSEQQKQAIHYLVMDRWTKGDLNAAVADNVGVLPVTITKWRKSSLFREEYDRQVKLYRANFDDVQLADRKERVKKLEAIYENLTDSQTAMKIKILSAIRAEVGDDKIEVEVTHQGAVGVNLPPRASTYEEWNKQNAIMDKDRIVDAEVVEEPPVEPPEKVISELPARFSTTKGAISRVNDQFPVGTP